MFECCDTFLVIVRDVRNLIDALWSRSRSLWKGDTIHKGGDEGYFGVSPEPFVDAFLDEASGNVSRGVLTVWKDYLSFRISLALAFVDIGLTG